MNGIDRSLGPGMEEQTGNGESARLAALYSYDLLDTPRESQFDRITAIASRFFGAPCALALLDERRLWVKSAAGLDLVELERDLAPCRYTIQGTDVMVVPDTLADPRFADSVFANDMGIRFYAGAPLYNPAGYALGTLVVLDTQPRAFAREETAALSAFASIVVDEIELRRKRAVEAHETQQLRSLLSESPLAIFTIDTRGTVLSWNPGATHIFGFAAEAVIGQTLPMVRPQDRRSCENFIARVAAGETISSWRMTTVNAAGAEVDVSVTATPMHDREGHVTGVLIIVEDVTQRMRLERRDANRSRVLEYVATGASRDDALAAIVNVVEGSFDRCLAVITAIDGDDLRIAAASPNIGTVYRPEVERLSLTAGASPCSLSVERRSIVVAHDVRNDPTYSGLSGVMTETGIASIWSAPVLLRDGTVAGTVVASFIEHTEPSEADLRLLADAAHLCGIVLERYADSERLEKLALYDHLTGLPNRVFFEQHLRSMLAAAERSGETVAVGMVDLDRFKAVNDTYGHRTGDEVLATTATLLTRTLRPGDILARRGGDEFLLLLPGVADAPAARAVADRLCAALRAEHIVPGVEVAIRASVGVTLIAPTGGDLDALVDRCLQEADSAMYAAKQRGDSTVVYSRSTAGAQNQALEPMLSRALALGELVLYYQPQIDSTSGEIIGCEALLRWNHPHLGLLVPSDFLAIAEESGLIVSIGAMVIEEACRAARDWHDAGMCFPVAINLSPRQLDAGDLVDVVASALASSGLPPDALELEISERVVLSSNDRVHETLARLKALGVRLTIDDFGTGYSNLAALNTDHIDGLKVDKSFVDRLCGIPSANGRSLEIVRAIVALARALNLSMVAEGVETDEQRRVLQTIACTRMQGYLWSHPLPRAILDRWLIDALAANASNAQHAS